MDNLIMYKPSIQFLFLSMKKTSLFRLYYAKVLIID